jgi:hypothetical protein
VHGRIINANATRVVDAVLDAVEQAIKEDPTAPAGLRLDIPSLATTMLSEFREDDRPGPYFRATIGAGYAAAGGGYFLRAGSPETSALFYEELGFGYRTRATGILDRIYSSKKVDRLGKDVLVGPHAIASGMLFRASSNDYMKSRAFFGAGLSLNAYRLLDFSASVGWMPRLTEGPGDPTGVVAFLAGVQLPLIDYVQALSEGASTTESAAAK